MSWDKDTTADRISTVDLNRRPALKQHIEDAERLTLLWCSNCGWRSEELTREQVRDLGHPWACRGTCGKYNVRWVHYAPSEREEAQRIAGLKP